MTQCELVPDDGSEQRCDEVLDGDRCTYRLGHEGAHGRFISGHPRGWSGHTDNPPKAGPYAVQPVNPMFLTDHEVQKIALSVGGPILGLPAVQAAGFNLDWLKAMVCLVAMEIEDVLGTRQ